MAKALELKWLIAFGTFEIDGRIVGLRSDETVGVARGTVKFAHAPVLAQDAGDLGGSLVSDGEIDSALEVHGG
jgi:hypothetical protein